MLLSFIEIIFKCSLTLYQIESHAKNKYEKRAKTAHFAPTQLSAFGSNKRHLGAKGSKRRKLSAEKISKNVDN